MTTAMRTLDTLLPLPPPHGQDVRPIQQDLREVGHDVICHDFLEVFRRHFLLFFVDWDAAH